MIAALVPAVTADLLVAPVRLAGLAAACALLIAVPGPSVLFVVGRALSYGRGVALASVLGNSSGSYLAAVCVAVGLGPLLQRSEVAFEVLKLLGAAYLVWLGVHALRSSRTASTVRPAAGVGPRAWPAVRSGLLVGLTNPKAFVIFAAVLPPFVDRGAGHVVVQMLVLALVPVGIGLVTDSAWALGAGRARAWLSGTPGRMRAVGRVGGLCTIGLGVSVAAAGRSD